MTEEFQFVDIDGERVFAAFHHSIEQPTRAVIICHPMGEEKLWAHRVLVTFARDLARAGFLVARFDFRGEGDSDRQFEESTLETRVQDTCSLMKTVKTVSPGVDEVSLLGLRVGATVATAVAARSPGVSNLILWDPIVDGAAYMQAVLRWNLMFQMAQHQKVLEDRTALVTRLAEGGTVNIEGYELGGPLYRQVADFSFENALCAFSGRTLVLRIAQGELSDNDALRAAAMRAERCDFDVVREEPFWRETKSFCQRSEALTTATMDWLEVEDT